MKMYMYGVGKDFKLGVHGLFEHTILAFALRDRKTTKYLRKAGNPAEIETEYLLNTHLACYHYANLTIR
jgi:hypothetical protein